MGWQKIVGLVVDQDHIRLKAGPFFFEKDSRLLHCVSRNPGIDHPDALPRSHQDLLEHRRVRFLDPNTVTPSRGLAQG